MSMSAIPASSVAIPPEVTERPIAIRPPELVATQPHISFSNKRKSTTSILSPTDSKYLRTDKNALFKANRESWIVNRLLDPCIYQPLQASKMNRTAPEGYKYPLKSAIHRQLALEFTTRFAKDGYTIGEVQMKNKIASLLKLFKEAIDTKRALEARAKRDGRQSVPWQGAARNAFVHFFVMAPIWSEFVGGGTFTAEEMEEASRQADQQAAQYGRRRAVRAQLGTRTRPLKSSDAEGSDSTDTEEGWVDAPTTVDPAAAAGPAASSSASAPSSAAASVAAAPIAESSVAAGKKVDYQRPQHQSTLQHQSSQQQQHQHQPQQQVPRDAAPKRQIAPLRQLVPLRSLGSARELPPQQHSSRPPGPPGPPGHKEHQGHARHPGYASAPGPSTAPVSVPVPQGYQEIHPPWPPKTRLEAIDDEISALYTMRRYELETKNEIIKHQMDLSHQERLTEIASRERIRMAEIGLDKELVTQGRALKELEKRLVTLMETLATRSAAAAATAATTSTIGAQRREGRRSRSRSVFSVREESNELVDDETQTADRQDGSRSRSVSPAREGSNDPVIELTPQEDDD